MVTAEMLLLVTVDIRVLEYWNIRQYETLHSALIICFPQKSYFWITLKSTECARLL